MGIDHPSNDYGLPKSHRLLAMVPRGLQRVISNLMNEVAKCAYVGEPTNEVGEKARVALVAQQSKKKGQSAWFQNPVGTVSLSSTNHVSVGYTPDQPVSWSVGGQVMGSVWLQIETEDVSSIVPLRCLGPLMALVSVGNISSVSDGFYSMKELTQQVSDWVSSSGTYRQDFDAALRVWVKFVELSWKQQVSVEYYDALMDRIRSNQLRFRLSCVRENSDLPYSRQELLKSIMDTCDQRLLPASQCGLWKASMTQFDVELVLVLLDSGCATLGISLRPYAYLKSKSFAYGGVPPDLTPPYIGGDMLSGLVRLRPTTAHVLLRLAQVKPYDVVLDPCAGIGTIPIEADRYFEKTVGLGGDVVVNHPSMVKAAGALEKATRPTGPSTSSLLATWDATHLPIRASSVDAIVSDLPFGQQCLSSSALNQLLPLIFLECARVLALRSGRMVILCGTPAAVARALEESEAYWVQPCTMVTPITISGLSAWTMRVERNEVAYDSDQHVRRLERVRKVARKRDRVAQITKNDTQKKRKRRVQAG